jgi:hypothetical protein
MHVHDWLEFGVFLFLSEKQRKAAHKESEKSDRELKTVV